MLATTDTMINTGCICNIHVSAPFEDREEWLVEKLIIGTDTANVLAAPTTLINSKSPFLHIANTSTRPWYICAGDIVGHLVDPDQLDQ